MDLPSAFRRSVERTPERPALVDLASGTEYTYEELDRAVASVATGFHERGVGEGDRVGICMANRVEQAVTALAAQSIGAVPVPFNFRVAADGVTYHLDDAEPVAFVFGPISRDSVTTAAGSYDCEMQFYAGEDPPGFAEPFDTLQETDPRDVFVDIDSDQESIILYSSGTTGDPKGIPISHEAGMLRSTSKMLGQQFYFDRTMLGVMPLYHTVGFHGIFGSLMFESGTYLCMPEFDPERAVEAIEEWEVTALYEAPAVFQALLNTDAIEETDVSSVEKMAYSGAPMSEALCQEVLDAFEPARFCNIYGNTETYDPLRYLDVRDVEKPTVTGTANTFHRARIVELGSNDPEATVEQGEEGELIVHTDSPASFDGYLNKPRQTEQAITDGWFFTSDAAYETENGTIAVTGRADDLIISGGENIHPVDVENVLASHDAVEDVAVIGQPDEEWGEIVFAYIVGDVDAETLDEYCLKSDALADFKRPRGYEFVEELPRNASGKIMRYKLRDDE